MTYLLLVGLVDSVHGVFNGNAFEIPCRYFHPQREVQINLLDGRVGKHGLEDSRVLDRVGRRVDLPKAREVG